MSARAILQSVIEDGATRPACREEARRMLALFHQLGVDDVRDAVVYLLGLAAGQRERIAEMEVDARLAPPAGRLLQ